MPVFLQKPLELRYQKQRVKVLASVLDAFHFEDDATMGKAKSMLGKIYILRNHFYSG